MDKTIRNIIVLAALSCVIFMLGNQVISLTDPDEVFYGQTAKEMVARHEWNIPFLFDQPQFEKPILIYWLLRVAFIIFGITNFAARFFPALFAIMGVIGAYLFAMAGSNDSKKAFISAIVLMSSILYIALARTVFTDMIFTVLILLAMLSFFWGYSYPLRRDKGIILFFLFTALATLAKGPLGLMLPLATIMMFLFIRKETRSFFRISVIYGAALFMAICLPWYIFMTLKFGNNFIHEFFYNDHIRRIFVAEHPGNDRWYFYPVTILGLFLPWSFFLVAALYRLARSRLKLLPIEQLMLCWIAVIFVVFQAAHSKLVSYIMPLFPALALICGSYIGDLMKNIKRRPMGKIPFLLSCLAFLMLPTAITLVALKFGISPSPIAGYIFTAIFAVWFLFTMFFIFKARLRVVFYLLAFALPVLFIANPIKIKEIELYFSSEDIGIYLQKKYPSVEHVLTSKSFARGILYYSGKQVVIFAPGESGYFSPHPVTFLDTEEKVADFLRRGKITYCVLKKKHVASFKSIVQRIGFKCELLKVSGNAFLFKVGK